MRPCNFSWEYTRKIHRNTGTKKTHTNKLLNLSCKSLLSKCVACFLPLDLYIFLFLLVSLPCVFTGSKADVSQQGTPMNISFQSFCLRLSLFSAFLSLCFSVWLKFLVFVFFFYPQLHSLFSAFFLPPSFYSQSSSAVQLTVWNMTSHFALFLLRNTHIQMHTLPHTFAYHPNPKCYFKLLWSWGETGAYWDEAWGLGGDNVGMIVCSAGILFLETPQKLNPTRNQS